MRAEIHLRLARRVHQLHEHFLVALCQFPHHLLHHHVTALETSLFKPLPNAFGSVPLLAPQQLVLLHDLFQPLLV